MTTTDFMKRIERLRSLMVADYFLLEIDNSKIWPHFRISGLRNETPVIKGYFVEGGSSYYQISESGREMYTRDLASSCKYLDEIEATVSVIALQGCVETRWKNKNGALLYSVIRLTTYDLSLVFGKAPWLWTQNLIKENVTFLPFKSAGAPGLK